MKTDATLLEGRRSVGAAKNSRRKTHPLPPTSSANQPSSREASPQSRQRVPQQGRDAAPPASQTSRRGKVEGGAELSAIYEKITEDLSAVPRKQPEPQRLLCAILIPNFSLQSLLRHTPERAHEPIALIPDKTPRARITECTPAALAGGAEPGMTPTQAQARCENLEIVLRSEPAERSARAALLDCAGAFAPYVEDTAPGVATLELKTTSRLNPAHLAASIQARLARLHLTAQIGFASTPSLALLAAQSADSFSPALPHHPGSVPRNDGVSPSCDPNARSAHLDPPRWRQIQSAADLHHLPLHALPFTPRMLEILARWGITDLAGFVRLGRENLAERLGPEILPLFVQATGATDRPLKCLPPAQSYEEAIEFEHDIETLDPLLFTLRRLLEQIIVRLETTYLVAAKLTLRLGFSHRAPYERTFKIPAPTAKAEVLFRALHTHLEQFTAEEPIISLALAAEPCRPPRQQFGLFESALRDPNQFYETLARLAALLGNDRVGFPEVEDTHRPDSFHLRETAPETTASPSSSSSSSASRTKFQNSQNPSVPKNTANQSQNSQNPFAESFRLAQSSRAPLAAPPWKSFQNSRNPEKPSDQSDQSDAAGVLRAEGPTQASPRPANVTSAALGTHPTNVRPERTAQEGVAITVAPPREAPIVLKFPTPESTGVGAPPSHCHPERSAGRAEVAEGNREVGGRASRRGAARSRRISNSNKSEGGGEQPSNITSITAFLPTPAPPTPTPDFQNFQNPNPPLTLRRFRPPLPAYVDLTPQRQPTAFTSAAIRGQVAAASGPIQISGEWWGDRAWSRFEWDLELTDGLLCRLYYDAVEQQWFLEGLYD